MTQVRGRCNQSLHEHNSALTKRRAAMQTGSERSTARTSVIRGTGRCTRTGMALPSLAPRRWTRASMSSMVRHRHALSPSPKPSLPAGLRFSASNGSLAATASPRLRTVDVARGSSVAVSSVRGVVGQPLDPEVDGGRNVSKTAWAQAAPRPQHSHRLWEKCEVGSALTGRRVGGASAAKGHGALWDAEELKRLNFVSCKPVW